MWRNTKEIYGKIEKIINLVISIITTIVPVVIGNPHLLVSP